MVERSQFGSLPPLITSFGNLDFRTIYFDRWTEVGSGCAFFNLWLSEWQCGWVTRMTAPSLRTMWGVYAVAAVLCEFLMDRNIKLLTMRIYCKTPMWPLQKQCFNLLDDTYTFNFSLSLLLFVRLPFNWN